jgi:hypothetical protein
MTGDCVANRAARKQHAKLRTKTAKMTQNPFQISAKIERNPLILRNERSQMPPVLFSAK